MTSTSERHLLLVSGTRQVGKDTLLKFLSAIDGRITRFSFADRLKEDLSGLLMDQFGIDPFNCTATEKELTRPILIAYGCAWRAIDPDHWVNLVASRVLSQQNVDESFIPAISDGRFENEVVRLREVYGKNLHHIDITRIGAPPPTDEEEKHFRKVAALADYHVNWGNNSIAEQLDRARAVHSWLLSNGLPPNS